MRPDERDLLPMEGVSELHSIINTGSTATVAGTDNTLRTIRQFFQRLS